MPKTFHALSIKQPWAALLAHGLKTIEVRQWSTARRGPVLIHASRQADDRPEAWKMLSRSMPETTVAGVSDPGHTNILETAKLQGGIIGIADLVDCVQYRTRRAFAVDRKKHWNDPAWFEGPIRYGFVFENARPVFFQKVPGWFKFFAVEVNERDMLEPPKGVAINSQACKRLEMNAAQVSSPNGAIVIRSPVAPLGLRKVFG